MNEDLVERVLEIVESIPAGRVVTYGDIAAQVGTGARQIGRIMAYNAMPVPWWRVVRADGSLPNHLLAEAQRQWQREGTAVRKSGQVDVLRHRHIFVGPIC